MIQRGHFECPPSDEPFRGAWDDIATCPPENQAKPPEKSSNSIYAIRFVHFRALDSEDRATCQVIELLLELNFSWIKSISLFSY